ncbi:MAG: type 4a pilus biogenesis protein PilO [Alysiella sp.]|uniref:type 4a pilus biogenesis protein PilO n=1 Tax=Alysiella sp. TaxID=1872483 RepID=UPI0026DADD8B|nr:type 4a pilus biogenesis protein PilO [Alysiella sp.]MDO4434174.1 type 4a pilus biogenesis protein PilO [Alysiella sp.]
MKSLDLNNLHKQSKGVQLICAAILAAIIVGLSYFLLFSDQITEYETATQKEEELKTEYTNKSTMAANLDNLKEELALIEQSISVLLKKLPTNDEIPSLIQEMHQAAAKNGLTMSALTPATPINEGQIQRLPFSISLNGSHEQIADFTRDIGRMSRIVTLSDMNIKNADTNNLNGNKLSFAAYANTYKALDTTSASGASAASTAQ